MYCFQSGVDLTMRSGDYDPGHGHGHGILIEALKRQRSAKDDETRHIFTDTVVTQTVIVTGILGFLIFVNFYYIYRDRVTV